MDIAALVESFATGTYNVTRRAAATVNRHGIKVPGESTTIPIRASITPASGRDMIDLPEGRRAGETRTLYTTTALVVGGQDAEFEPDTVTIDGEEWEVQTVARWQIWGASSTGYRCLVARPS